MNLPVLRTAVLAGGCALALAFVPMTATAAVLPASEPGSHGRTSTDDPTTNATSDDSTDDGSADDASDDQGADDQGADDQGADDQGEDGHGRSAERHGAKGRVDDDTVAPHELERDGVKVVFTGLTPRARYQPYWTDGTTTGSIGGARKADDRGVLRFSWKPAKNRVATGTFQVGLQGVDTVYDSTRTVEVKYDSDLSLERADRHGKRVSLTAEATRTTRSGASSTPWKRVEVDFQKRVGTTWVTVATDETDARGVATATVRADAHVWRAVVDGTATVFGSRTKAHHD
jgi:hypothetical protein